MPPRARRAPLAAIAEDVAAGAHGLGGIAEDDESDVPLPEEVLAVVAELEAQVEARMNALASAAEDAVVSLRNECKRVMVLVPQKCRKMPFKQFQEQYPDDFQAGALAEIRARYAALAAAAAAEAAAAAAARGARTAAKRAAEPPTALRTVRARRAGPSAAAAGAAPPAAAASEAGSLASGATAAAPPVGAAGMFMGRALATPMPFAGAAAPVPVTMLARQRGGRTAAAAAPDAAVVTTSDGQQWALGRGGMAAIPETHRSEVTELLAAQFEFLAAALGKTVGVGRGQGGGGGRRR